MQSLKRTFHLALLSLAMLLLLPLRAAAHGSVYTFKYVDGDNFIMVTHNVHDARAGAPITYDMRLYTLEGEPVHIEAVAVRVMRGSRVVHQQRLPIRQYDQAQLTYTYPTSGKYLLTLDFLDHAKQVAHGEFPIQVEKGLDDGFWDSAFTRQTLVALLAGMGLAALYQRRAPAKKWLGSRIKARQHHS